MKIEQYSREEAGILPKTPMPFYVFSVGNKVLSENEVEIANGLKNSFVEIVWSLSGIGEVTYYGQRFQMQKNDIFFFLPGEEHNLRGISKEWHSRWLCLDGPFAEANFLAFRFPRFQHTASNCPVELFDEIARWISSDDPLQIGRISALALMILAHARGEDLQLNTSNALYCHCLEYIKKNYSNPDLCIGMLCDVFQTPRSTLTKIFYDNMHRSLGNFIRDCRYGHALALLRGSDLPVKEVARRCGYRELTSFSRLIRRATGMGPVELRKQNRTNQNLSRETS